MMTKETATVVLTRQEADLLIDCWMEEVASIPKTVPVPIFLLRARSALDAIEKLYNTFQDTKDGEQ